METLTTTIEWHLAEKELPEKSGEYLTVQPYGGVRALFFSEEHKKFNVLDFMDAELAEERAIRCVYWAEIPDCFSWDNLAKYREG